MRFSKLFPLLLIAGCSMNRCLPLKRVDPESTHYLNKSPFISPLLIRELQTWISDYPDHAQVVALDVAECQGSNRFSGEIQVVPGKNGKSPTIFVEEAIGSADRKDYFSYEWLGKSSSGIHVLITKDSGGGTMVETGIMLVEFVHEKAYSLENKKWKRNRHRTLIRRVGEYSLGDRYLGHARLEGEKLVIPKDENKSIILQIH